MLVFILKKKFKEKRLQRMMRQKNVKFGANFRLCSEGSPEWQCSSTNTRKSLHFSVCYFSFYFQKANKFQVPSDDLHIFFNMYNAYFDAKTQENKWRSKIVLEKLLYTEWKKRFFEPEFSTIGIFILWESIDGVVLVADWIKT